ncbi:MAG TPA: hypothetical protein VFJ29_07785, partial [Candidatus Kapabacteria bacterium]|nr:hypothetical protein [Candidatus Kapabacteria bacterium]
QDIPASYFPVSEKQQLIEVLSATLRNDDVILVKGSRGVRMEDIVTGLKKNMPVKTTKRK